MVELFPYCFELGCMAAEIEVLRDALLKGITQAHGLELVFGKFVGIHVPTAHLIERHGHITELRAIVSLNLFEREGFGAG